MNKVLWLVTVTDTNLIPDCGLVRAERPSDAERIARNIIPEGWEVHIVKVASDAERMAWGDLTDLEF